MIKFRWAWVAVLLALGALMFGACDGGDDNDDGDDEPVATEPAGDGEDGGEEPEEEEQQEEEEEEEPSGGGDAGDFRGAAGNFIDATFTAEYDATFSGGGEGTPSAFTMYKSGTDKFRFDATSNVSGQEMEFIFISAGDTTGFCLTDAGELAELLGVPAGEGVCFDSDPTNGGLDSLTAELDDFEDEQLGDATGLPDREIAGQTAKCGTVTEEDGTTSEACFTEDGVLVYLSTSDGTQFTATNISGDVSDSDFELPYEVRDFPGLGGGGE
jgi:hypothetical protein